MKAGEIDFGLGVIRHDTLDLEHESRKEDLSEDLLQVEYQSSDLVLDVGWYDRKGEHSEFVILLVRHSDWEKPIADVRLKTLSDLRRELQRIASMANEIESRSVKDE